MATAVAMRLRSAAVDDGGRQGRGQTLKLRATLMPTANDA